MSRVLRFTEEEFQSRMAARMRSKVSANENEPKPAPYVSRQTDRAETEATGDGIDALARQQGSGVVSKYRAVKTVVDGITFASKAEAKRYQELKVLENLSEIWDLKLQPVFVLADSVTINGRRKPSLRYVADFEYMTTAGRVIEDVKGMLTPVYRLKRHLMKSQLGIDIQEITK